MTVRWTVRSANRPRRNGANPSLSAKSKRYPHKVDIFFHFCIKENFSRLYFSELLFVVFACSLDMVSSRQLSLQDSPYLCQVLLQAFGIVQKYSIFYHFPISSSRFGRYLSAFAFLFEYILFQF